MKEPCHCGIFQKKSINLQRYGNFRTFSYPDFKRFIQIHKHHENNMRKQASKQVIDSIGVDAVQWICVFVD
jgi:hypothetical protein